MAKCSWLTCLIISVSSSAQQIDSIGNIIYRSTSEWKSLVTESYRQYTYYANDNSFCQVTLYNPRSSSGNKTADFENEWIELVEKNFTVFTLASPAIFKSKKGFTMLRRGARGTDQAGNNYYVQLNVFDCDRSIQSVVVVSGSKKQLEKYDTAWQSLIVTVKIDQMNSAVHDNSGAVTSPESSPGSSNGEAPGSNGPVPADRTITGKWAKSSGSPPQYQNGRLVNLVSNGYHKGQYDFKNDGSYTFHGESMFNSNDYAIVDERGTYSVAGDQLAVTPRSATIQKVDINGQIKKSEQLSLSKRTYHWKLHYFEGIQETNLILSGGAENVVNGGYASNSLFPGSFLYSQQLNPEWKFNFANQ